MFLSNNLAFPIEVFPSVFLNGLTQLLRANQHLRANSLKDPDEDYLRGMTDREHVFILLVRKSGNSSPLDQRPNVIQTVQ